MLQKQKLQKDYFLLGKVREVCLYNRVFVLIFEIG